MSGFLGQIIGSATGLMTALPALLSQWLGTAEGATGGGLPVLLSQLENVGLGEEVKSWVGTDPNLPITAEHITAAVPPEQLQKMASDLGVPHEQAAEILAQVLPHAVDHATPEGKLPLAGTPPVDYSKVVTKVLKD